MTLIEQTQHFEHIVRQHSPRLLAAARRVLGDDDEAHDALQDAYGAAFRALHGFRGEASLSTWLYRIVLNSARMRRRARSRRRETSIDEAELGLDLTELDYCVPTRPDAALEAKQDGARLRQCIDRLPPSYRSVILLRDIEDRTTDAAAQHLAISPNAVKVRLHRARRALWSLLRDGAAPAEGSL
jgi:RNA polymerase sigma-70 factor (ECF subfamily)